MARSHRKIFMWPAIRDVDVPVGVLEHASTVIKTHTIFCLDPDSPTWYTARNLMISAQPDPATFDTTNQVVEDIDTFSAEAHHGTHVAALIAGRDGECWSSIAIPLRAGRGAPWNLHCPGSGMTSGR